MKALIVYFSKFGNTRRLAEAVAEVLKQAGDTRMVSIDQLAAPDFEGADLVVMGTPTHGLTVPPGVRAALEALPPGILADKAVAAFDTTVKPWPLCLMRASPKLLRQLQSLGGKPVAPPETFSVKTIGPQQPGEVDLLFAGEIEHARKWAGNLLQQLAKAAPAQ
jgi:flavodoxin